MMSQGIIIFLGVFLILNLVSPVTAKTRNVLTKTPLRRPRLHPSCVLCLCYVNGCNLTRGCSEDGCGPFALTQEYWSKADKPTLLYDNPDRDRAFQDCANDYSCAMTIINNYFAKFAKDCNNDGIINCLDYVMLHFYDSEECFTPLFLTSRGLKILTRFEKCQALKDDLNKVYATVHLVTDP